MDDLVQPGSDAASAHTPSEISTPNTSPSKPAVAGPAVVGTLQAIKVVFALDTLDGLRKISFGLEKDLKGTDPIYTIHFQLQERLKTTDPFIDVVTLDVTIDDAALHPAAQAVMTNNGLTPPQAAHAVGPAADDAKGTTTGDVDPDDAHDTIQNTFAVK